MAKLDLKQVKHLASAAGGTVRELEYLADHADEFVEDLVLIDPRRPDKRRHVINITGPLRSFQSRLHRRLLVHKLRPSPYSHGGVRTKSVKTNADPHVRSRFVYKIDIQNFYPSIHRTRVYRLLTDRLGCSPDVAHFMTRLCTVHNHLALGLVTSPILADQVLKRSDRRIGEMCKKIGLAYSRFVDDITISAAFDLAENNSISRMVEGILKQDGFRIRPDKRVFGAIDNGITITGVAIRRGRLDVSREFVVELERQISDASSLANDGPFEGPYFTRSQILGRVHYAAWIAPGRKRSLIRRFRDVPWSRTEQNAARRGYVSCRTQLRRQITPDFRATLPGLGK